jgi:hypothetical protein
MKKLIFVFLSLFIFSTITLPEPSLAATHHKQKKAVVCKVCEVKKKTAKTSKQNNKKEGQRSNPPATQKRSTQRRMY